MVLISKQMQRIPVQIESLILIGLLSGWSSFINLEKLKTIFWIIKTSIINFIMPKHKHVITRDLIWLVEFDAPSESRNVIKIKSERLVSIYTIKMAKCKIEFLCNFLFDFQ